MHVYALAETQVLGHSADIVHRPQHTVVHSADVENGEKTENNPVYIAYSLMWFTQ